MITIDGRAAVRAEVGGVERYAREVTGRLMTLAPDRYRILSPPPGLAHRAGHVWEQLVLPSRTRGDELVYCPANLAPLVGRSNVVVIHDTAVHSQPAAYSGTYRAYQRAMLPALAQRAKLVITVSEFSRGEIVEHLGVRPERVAVISPGVDSRFSPSADAAGTARELGQDRPYVLVVGTASSRKNHGALTAVASALTERGIDLLLAGSGRDYLRRTEYGTGAARRLGYVPERLLPGLYAGALALVMPSLYEGFGLPCIEAMASGVPVIAANTGALPETCGPAALLVDPRADTAIAGAVLAVITDDAPRRRLIAEGLLRAQSFSWDRTAATTNAAMTALLPAHEAQV